MQSITAGSHAGYDPSRELSLIIGKSHAGHLISGLKIPARTRADYLESHAGLQIPGENLLSIIPESHAGLKIPELKIPEHYAH